MTKYIKMVSYKKYLSVILIILLSSTYLKAQSNIDKVLTEVLKNNKAIQANKQYWESRKLQFKTGLYPENPQVEYDYLFGTPENVGNQTEITAFQSFDFPSAYIKKNQLAKEQTAQTEIQLISKRQEIL